MMITVHCDCEDCYCNEDGYCCADAGLYIDSTGECETYEPKDNWDALDDIEKEEAMNLYREQEGKECEE